MQGRAQRRADRARLKDKRRQYLCWQWCAALPRVKYGSADRPLRIGDVEIPCYVLEDGTRVLSQRGLQSGIGMSLSGGSAGEQRIVTFIDSLEKKCIVVIGLSVRIRNPIQFIPTIGGRPAYGFEATILADSFVRRALPDVAHLRVWRESFG